MRVRCAVYSVQYSGDANFRAHCLVLFLFFSSSVNTPLRNGSVRGELVRRKTQVRINTRNSIMTTTHVSSSSSSLGL